MKLEKKLKSLILISAVCVTLVSNLTCQMRSNELIYLVQDNDLLDNYLSVTAKLMQNHQYFAAIPLLRGALIAVPGNDEAEFRLAYCLHRTGRTGEAIVVWKRLTKKRGAIGTGAEKFLKQFLK